MRNQQRVRHYDIQNQPRSYKQHPSEGSGLQFTDQQYPISQHQPGRKYGQGQNQYNYKCNDVGKHPYPYPSAGYGEEEGEDLIEYAYKKGFRREGDDSM
jgi:hypothetical protein